MGELFVDEIVGNFHFRRIEQRDKDLYMSAREKYSVVDTPMSIIKCWTIAMQSIGL